VYKQGWCSRRLLIELTEVLRSFLPCSAEVLDAPLRKSPKRDSAPSVARANTPEAEQRPCTSKQSHSPQKSGDVKSPTDKSYSSFYQELLEASYADEGELENAL